jgi:four helix bundle protein
LEFETCTVSVKIKKEFDNFLGIALGSSIELDTQIIISNRLDYINDQDFQHLESELDHLQNMIVKLKKSLNIH